ncbi:transmembrane and coiled-coil domain protein 3-like [Diretmus argenteus]
MRRGSSETNLDLDLSDGGPAPGAEVQRSRSGLDSLQQKILKVTEQLKIEQSARDENVAEYLKLVNSADKQQVGRIKQVFEKKNQKSAQNISHMQKKLEQYHRKMKDNESFHGPSTSYFPSARHSTTLPRESPKLLRDVTGSGRHPTLDKIKTIGPGVSLSPPFFFSKPREFANLIRNKFGSADNIAHLKTTLDAPSPFPPDSAGKGLSSNATMVAKAKYPSDDDCSSGSASISADSNGMPMGGGVSGEPGQSHGQGQETGGEGPSRLALSLEELREIREAQSQLEEELEEFRAQFKTEYGILSQTLQEEKYRYGHLEDQLNDLSELHQHETADLKQELVSIEERVAYQAHERARDIQEALESCQTRVSKLELQQQHQQAVQLESRDARVLLGKSINIMLAIITVILVCVSTAAKFAAPLMRSRHHVMATVLGVCFLAIFWRNWDRLQCAVDRVLVPA